MCRRVGSPGASSPGCGRVQFEHQGSGPVGCLGVSSRLLDARPHASPGLWSMRNLGVLNPQARRPFPQLLARSLGCCLMCVCVCVCVCVCFVSACKSKTRVHCSAFSFHIHCGTMVWWLIRTAGNFVVQAAVSSRGNVSWKCCSETGVRLDNSNGDCTFPIDS